MRNSDTNRHSSDSPSRSAARCCTRVPSAERALTRTGFARVPDPQTLYRADQLRHPVHCSNKLQEDPPLLMTCAFPRGNCVGVRTADHDQCPAKVAGFSMNLLTASVRSLFVDLTYFLL